MYTLVKRLPLLVAGILVAVALGQSKASAQETEGTNITVTVLNAFNLTETAPLSFGTIAAFVDAGNTATYQLAPDGTPTLGSSGGTAAFVIFAAATPGVFDIDSAAPNTIMNITLPVAAVLACGACSGAEPDFDVATYVSDPTPTITTDGNGDGTILLGATMTSQTSAAPYEDGVYLDTYSMTIAY